MKIQEYLSIFDVDRAVFFGLLARIWGLGSGPVTAILIAMYFSPEIQGYYYTFTSILALQIFVELGLGSVTAQFASHEWAKLNLDESGNIVGDRDALSRLASIANITTRWFSIGGFLVAFGLGIGGYVFFSSSPSYNINWLSPWILLCFITGITICLVPIWSLLEGCNQVAKLYTFRFFQGALISITIWIAILSDAGLWTASVSGAASLFCSLFFLRRHYWVFSKTLLRTKHNGARISWRSDMLPMQWRIALSWISGYFCYFLFTPVLFKYHGPVLAGQMGMTWGIVGLVGSISASWIAPRIPQFGMLIAEKRYDDLDRLFWKITRIVIVITFLIALLIWSGVYLLNIINHPTMFRFSSRLLPPLTTAFFLLGQFINVVSSPFSSYLRAHKKEPMMILSVSSAIFIALATLILGKYYSALGVSMGYFVTHLIVIPFVFLIWVRCRKRWHYE